jgi:alpha-mannosidase
MEVVDLVQIDWREGNMRSILTLALVVLTCLPGSGNMQSLQSDSTRGGHLYVVGTAHLDTQWRWTIRETISDFVPATFADNFSLMDQYPDYVFSFEGAFRYMLLKEYYPEYYTKLKDYVDRDQWRVAGSWVDAVDVNLPSFESLVRHVLYGNGYFERELGQTSRDIFLPDCFGFGYALPSIAAHCGLKSFSTQKLSWGSAYGVPFDIGLWEGVDGSSIIAAIRPGPYVAKIRDDLSTDSAWTAAVDREGDTSGLYAAYMYFGTGDTGGSPDSLSVDWLEKSIHSDGPIKVASVGSDDIVDVVETAKDVNLPRYKGELVMTRHGVGCYSSEAAMKRWNRKNELLADATERAAVAAHLLGGMQYPTETLRDIWVRFLWHQFHDDLTGTSIPQAYEYSWNDEVLSLNRFAGILDHAVERTAAALDTRIEGTPVVVYNPLAIEREDVVEATMRFDDGAPEAVRVYGPGRHEVPSQITERYDDSLHVLFLAEAPSVGYAVYDVRPSKKPCDMNTGVATTSAGLENARYRVLINSNGDVSSVFDKSVQKELLSGPIAFQVLHDKPKQWPAWEIGYDDIMATPMPRNDEQASIEVVEVGPVRATVRISRKINGSTCITDLSLSAGEAGNQLVVDNAVNWVEKESLLKVAFPVSCANEKVTYDIGLGTIERGLNHPQLYEVPGQKWADIDAVDGSYGVAVLNDCKYGWDHPDSSTLRLTLIHTPGVYDNWSWVGDQSSQDLGRHHFAFALQGHKDDWRAGNVVWQAERLNQKLLAFQTSQHPGKLGRWYSLVNVGVNGEKYQVPQVMINAVKMAEDSDGLVIRLRELKGEPADSIRITFARPLVSAREINGAEKTIGDAVISDGSLVTSFRPYQPRAYAVTLEQAKPLVAMPMCEPLRLEYNLDGISLDSDRRDGDFDGNGHTLVGELLPDTVINGDVPFVTGPKGAGKVNVVTCEGQTLSIPDGPFDHICLLATAASGPAQGTFGIGKQDTTLWVQDYSERLGQWYNRLVGSAFVEEAAHITPEYILREPVAWVGTHRHGPDGENEIYQFTYLYYVELEIPANTRTVTLPNEPNLKILAATAVMSEVAPVYAAQTLYDLANATIVNVQAKRTSFLDSMVVQLSSPMPGAEVHYTLDGSEPSAASLKYAQPLVLKKTTTLKARALLASADDDFVTEVAFAKLIPKAAAVVTNPEPGLKCNYYEGEWYNLPDFDTLQIVKTAVVDSIGLPDFARPEDYGLVMTGFVKVPADGLYDFSITSDDGSALFVEDSLIANNDGIHGADEVSGEIALRAGLHPITVHMFQCKGGKYLEVSVKGPGLEKQPISAQMLFH